MEYENNMMRDFQLGLDAFPVADVAQIIPLSYSILSFYLEDDPSK
jgi:hypothetical protein